MLEYLVFGGIMGIGLFYSYKLSKIKKYEPYPDHFYEIWKTESPIERRLYRDLTAKGYVVKTQVPCGKYRIDLALPSYKIAIECDGKAYHSTPEQKAHDRRKNQYLQRNGWKVLRFSGKKIYRDLPGILREIEPLTNPKEKQ
ncbi:MAG: DUF559 domain-containing protein [Bacillaceae bacterium]|nr:DUF559 domain-containing protein [Bacillaceae bacterium]